MGVPLDEFERLHGVRDQVVEAHRRKGLRTVRPDLDPYMKPPADAHRVIPPTEIASRVIERAARGLHGAKLPWSKTHNRIRFASGQVTVWGGAMSSYKSTLLSQFVVGLCEQGYRTVVTSLEEPLDEYGWRLARQMQARGELSEVEIEAAFEALDERLWFWDVENECSAARAIAMMRWCADQQQIQHFVLDNVTCIVDPSNDNATEQWQLIRSAVRVARATGMHIHLVIHTRKGIHDNREKAPTVDDLRGSSTIPQQADQIILVWRNVLKEDVVSEAGSVMVEDPKTKRVKDWSEEPDVRLLVEKAKFTQYRGRITLWKQPQSWTFGESGLDSAAPSILLGGA